MATKRTPDVIRAEIKAIKQAFIGLREHRRAILEDALEQLRAQAVAEQIVALEDELTKLAP